MASPRPVLIIACAALARELVMLRRLNHWDNVEIQCLPAELHNSPDAIPARIKQILDRADGRLRQIVVAYTDCGTGGRLDNLLTEYNVQRLPGAHCYELFAGSACFDRLATAEPGTFFLTDFLVRHFERLVYRGLGLDRHPRLRADYFGNYDRLVYLAQTDSPDLRQKAQACAGLLDLDFHCVMTGLQPFARTLQALIIGTKHPPEEHRSLQGQDYAIRQTRGAPCFSTRRR